MNVIERLPDWLEQRPFVLLRFDWNIIVDDYGGSRERFTIAKPHGSFSAIKAPTLALIEIREESEISYCIAVLKSKTAVSTVDSRITLDKITPLDLSNLQEFASQLDARFAGLLREKIDAPNFATVLSPKLSVAMLDVFLKNPQNRKAIESTASHIPRFRRASTTEWEQLNAIKVALAAFGLAKASSPAFLETESDSDSTLRLLQVRETHILEDNVIAVDASVLPGFSLVEKFVTGRATFTKNNQRLDVYTANRGPLEEMFGVDLIYINQLSGSIVMVQYKMLERITLHESGEEDWIFRTNQQFFDEKERMKLPSRSQELDDYRLHRSPFFFKFVKRKGDEDAHQSFIVSLEHLNLLLQRPDALGPKGGLRVSFTALSGVYLRETDLIGLIRSGYIGTHRAETAALSVIIDEVAKGNRGLVLAWQQLVKFGSEPEDEIEGEE